jgi:hypothetical protein
MHTGIRFMKCAGMIVLVLCLGGLGFADSAQNPPAQNPPVHKKTKKAEKPAQPEPPPLPSGPTGKAVPQIPLDAIAAVAPEVDYQNGQLTINAPNSTLGDILRAVRKQTGADIDVPEARERVVTHLGPGPARQVIAELLNGSRFNYVLLGSPADNTVLTRIVLVAKTPEAAGGANPAMQQQAAVHAPGVGVSATPEAQDQSTDPSETDTPEENAAEETTPEPPAPEADQSNGDQNGVKTPQQLLQEMQQRQMQMQQQMQQQQQNGQPPTTGPMQRTPQQQQQQQDQ